MLVVDPFVGLARDFGPIHQNTIPSMRPQAAAQGKAARPGFLTELQAQAGVGGMQLADQFEHVVVLSADDPVTPHFGRIRWGQADGDGIIMHVQPNAQDGAFGGHGGCGFGAEGP